MTLTETLRLGLADRYLVEREIGAGGMATVYLARDLRHDRDVALKLLRPELGVVLGPERFLSEIRVTAKLQHPNLLPLFDSGETDGHLWYVMPFVEGESLRARLTREKQLSTREAVRIAAAIASALDYAHRHGVVHRDLKPENILLNEDQPLVADFGIALAVSNAGGERVTQTGLSLGTPQYMSPEQATGERVVDGRTDIYSLGAVLYEMLAGEPPHTGATVQAIIARVITDTPRSVRATRSSVPEHVDLAVRKALEKVPADRFETAREFCEVLQGQKQIAATGTAAMLSGGDTAAAALPRSAGRRLPWILAGVTAVLAVAAAAFGWRQVLLRDAAGDPLPVSFIVSPAGAEQLVSRSVAISPDGRKVVYVGLADNSSQLYLRDLGDVVTRVIPGTEGAEFPVFSPDGKWAAFFAAGELKRVPVDGGTAITIAGNVLRGQLLWTTSNRILIPTQSITRRRSGLSEVSPSGGAVTPIFASDTVHQENFSFPIELTDGETILFVSQGPGGAEDDKLAVGSLESLDHTVLEFGISRSLGYVDGHAIAIRGGGTKGAIVAVPLDLRGRRITGDPITLVGNVGQFDAALSRAGTLAYVSGAATSRLVAEDAAGASDTLTPQLTAYETPRLSPNGTHIAFTLPGTTTTDVWIYDGSGKTLSRLTASGGMPEWTSDGKRVLFVRPSTAAQGIWVRSADGGSAEEQLRPKLPAGAGNPFSATMSPDQATVAFVSYAGSQRRNIYYFKPGMDDEARPWLATEFDEISPRFSPDGRYVAYASDESGGSLEVFVRPFPGPGARVQISAGGGSEPAWSPDGRRVYYRNGQRVTIADLATGPEISVRARRAAFNLNSAQASGVPSYDVSPDGRRVVYAKPAGGDAKLVVVTNFATEVRRKVKEARP